MANLTKTLLEAIQDEIQTNANLSYIQQAYIVQAFGADYTPEIATESPVAFIYPISSTFEPDCLPDISNAATYIIGISVVQEWWDTDVGMVGDGGSYKGAAEIESDLQDVFDRNTFSDICYYAVFTGANYSPASFTQGMSQVHVTLEYRDQDLM